MTLHATEHSKVHTNGNDNGINESIGEDNSRRSRILNANHVFMSNFKEIEYSEQIIKKYLDCDYLSI